MTSHTDPRSGHTVFLVNSPTRGNPDPSLFQVPAEFQIKENSKANIEYKFLINK